MKKKIKSKEIIIQRNEYVKDGLLLSDDYIARYFILSMVNKLKISDRNEILPPLTHINTHSRFAIGMEFEEIYKRNLEKERNDDDDDDEEKEDDGEENNEDKNEVGSKFKINPKLLNIKPNIPLIKKELPNDIDLQLNTIIIDKSKKKLIINNHDLVNRNCYKIILNLINNSAKGKTCYLIFGVEGIGKTILSYYLCYYFSHYLLSGNESYNVLFISSENKFYYSAKDTGIFMKIDKYEKPENGKLVVIVDDIQLDSNTFIDVDIVILLSNPHLKKYKDFQSKRSPITIYIPPFTKNETKEYYDDDYCTFENAEIYGFIPGLFMHDSETDNDFADALVNEYKIQLRGFSEMEFCGVVQHDPANSQMNLNNISCYIVDKDDLTKLERYTYISIPIGRLVHRVFDVYRYKSNNKTRIRRRIEYEIDGDICNEIDDDDNDDDDE